MKRKTINENNGKHLHTNMIIKIKFITTITLSKTFIEFDSL